MKNPSEAIIEAVARAICEADCGRITENELARCHELAQAAICAMRAICKSCVQEFDIVTGHACSGQAATPATPVQDDDALVARLKQLRDMLDTGSEQSHLYLARQELASRLPEIIARLTPDRVTPLVEALRAIETFAPDEASRVPPHTQIAMFALQLARAALRAMEASNGQS